jgi:hypothetical protein
VAVLAANWVYGAKESKKVPVKKANDKGLAKKR